MIGNGMMLQHKRKSSYEKEDRVSFSASGVYFIKKGWATRSLKTSRVIDATAHVVNEIAGSCLTLCNFVWLEEETEIGDGKIFGGKINKKRWASSGTVPQELLVLLKDMCKKGKKGKVIPVLN
jgi:hypothetical protein